MHAADGSTRDLQIGQASGENFPVVGIGGSAGGLEAFLRFFKLLSVDTGMSFVLVQHLQQNRESLLASILGRVTSMPVCQAANALRVAPNHVYVIPPNYDMTIVRGALQLQAKATGSPWRPLRSIDIFFESLADDHGVYAMGVLFSGMLADGTLGMEAIKAKGGICFAQDHSAAQISMPDCAIGAGCVDFVLSPEKIATELGRISRYSGVGKETSALGEAAEVNNGLSHGSKTSLKTVLWLLRNYSGVDFSRYKSVLLNGRIARRMVLNKLNALDVYTSFLGRKKGELEALYSDLLINHTAFFSNSQAFELLERKIFPRLIRQVGDKPMRIWIVGCSTGQEAYSIAMAFVESAERAEQECKLQLYATDVNESALAHARTGLYPPHYLASISAERLRRFFVRENGGYRVTKALREMVVFARHNLLSDMPFTHMDLISCRNLLNYLKTELQQRVLTLLNYCLESQGFLLLGDSESVGTSTDLFHSVNKESRIFSKNAFAAASRGSRQAQFLLEEQAEKSSFRQAKRSEVEFDNQSDHGAYYPN